MFIVLCWSSCLGNRNKAECVPQYQESFCIDQLLSGSASLAVHSISNLWEGPPGPASLPGWSQLTPPRLSSGWNDSGDLSGIMTEVVLDDKLQLHGGQGDDPGAECTVSVKGLVPLERGFTVDRGWSPDCGGKASNEMCWYKPHSLDSFIKLMKKNKKT